MHIAILFLLGGLTAFAGLRTDIEFARVGGVSLRLDAWVPDEGTGPFPTVIVVHGGGWQYGDKKSSGKPHFEVLTQSGFTWFSINYRLAPAHTYPVAVEDVLTAIGWVQEHGKEYKANVKKLAILGESAGGHLVALIGARDGRRLKLTAVVPFYAPIDLEGLVTTAETSETADSSIRAFLGITSLDNEARKRLREASPITYVKRDLPPFLMIHGTMDPVVPLSESVKMCAAMKKAGASCELFTVEGGKHGVVGWEKVPGQQAYKAKMVDWLKQQFR
jgi:acetyl esterase